MKAAAVGIAVLWTAQTFSLLADARHLKSHSHSHSHFHADNNTEVRSLDRRVTSKEVSDEDWRKAVCKGAELLEAVRATDPKAAQHFGRTSECDNILTLVY